MVPNNNDIQDLGLPASRLRVLDPVTENPSRSVHFWRNGTTSDSSLV
jgi:hypothetical protein